MRSSTVVVKLGGSAMEDPAATTAVLRAVAQLHAVGTLVVLVHGGGKPIDRAMAEAGLTPIKVQGRRYTDEPTLAIVVRVLKWINANLAEQLNALGCRAVGLDAADQHALSGERLLLPGLDLQPFDLGAVGKVTSVNVPLLTTHGVVPIVASLATGTDGGYLNINADSAASAVAGALRARACVFLTDTPGVLRNRTDSTSLVGHLTWAECETWLADGTIVGGMIPKVEACYEALDAGASEAVILDGRHPTSLADWAAGKPSGTRITLT